MHINQKEGILLTKHVICMSMNLCACMRITFIVVKVRGMAKII